MFRQYREFDPGEFVVVGVDTSAGMGDYCAAHFMSKSRLDIPLVLHTKQTITEVTPRIHTALTMLRKQTNVKPVVAYERNNGGIFELERLGRLNKNGDYKIFVMPRYGEDKNDVEGKKLGWDTNSATRPTMLTDLKDGVDGNLFRIYDKPTVEEMFSFIKVATSSIRKAQAEEGAHDDLVMALAITWQLQQMEEKPVETFRTPVYRKEKWSI